MSSIIQPVDGTPKVGSRRIIDEFLSTGTPQARVATELLNREPSAVYSSLKLFIKNHPDIQVEARMIDGDIYLCRI